MDTDSLRYRFELKSNITDIILSARRRPAVNPTNHNVFPHTHSWRSLLQTFGFRVSGCAIDKQQCSILQVSNSKIPFVSIIKTILKLPKSLQASVRSCSRSVSHLAFLRSKTSSRISHHPFNSNKNCY